MPFRRIALANTRPHVRDAKTALSWSFHSKPPTAAGGGG